MRTTITIDDDVFKQIESLAEAQQRSRRDVLNDTLRRGIRAVRQETGERARFTTRSKDLGQCLIPSLDNVSEVLAVAEGDDFK